MKKALSLIMVLVICLSLCACGVIPDTLSKEEKLLVGEWEASDNHAGFILLSSGNAIADRDSLASSANSGTSAASGKWEVEGDFLIIHYEEMLYGGSIDKTRVYKIISDKQVKSGEITYTKK